MAGLPWIELGVDLPRNRKSVRLRLRLGEERAWAYMVQLWCWCAENLQAGTISGPDAGAVLEDAAGWQGEPGKLLEASIFAGFIDQDGETLTVHGWEERAAAHLAKLERDRDRSKARYERLRGKFGPKVAPPPAASVDSPQILREDSAGIFGNSNPNPNPNQKQLPVAQAASPPAAPADPPRALREKPQLGANPRHAPLVAQLADVFREARGVEYGFQGGKDGRAVATLLLLGPDQEILTRWKRALKLERFPGCSSIAELAQRWNHLGGNPPATGPPGKPKATAQPSDPADFKLPAPF